MPRMRDFLSRFRPAGAPGAGRAAVPADRRRQLESELGPVLALLDAPNAECYGIIAAVQRDAGQIIEDARSDADAIRSAGRERAAGLTGDLVEQALAAAQAEAGAIITAGASDAAAIRERVRERVPALAGRAVRLIRDLAGPDDAADAGEGRPS